MALRMMAAKRNHDVNTMHISIKKRPDRNQSYAPRQRSSAVASIQGAAVAAAAAAAAASAAAAAAAATAAAATTTAGGGGGGGMIAMHSSAHIVVVCGAIIRYSRGIITFFFTNKKNEYQILV